MVNPILKTKLFVPQAQAHLVPRLRLLDHLDAARRDGCRVALVSAPAGSGKTTVVVQWLERCGWPVCWLSLDERDNTPARFFAYLIAALQSVAPGAGAEAETLLELPAPNLEEICALLSNDLAAAPGPFLVALDDLHTLTNPMLLHALDFLIESQPPGMRWLLLSREDPDLQLARRRVSGQLIELRQDDLRFTLEEAAAFLNQGMGLELSTAQVQALETRTEGWVAGLQMAALSLQRQTDPDRFIREFSGSHRFILDYLMEEVLARQPDSVQQFLLSTAVLERMCAGLCAAVTNIQDGGELTNAAVSASGAAVLQAQQVLDGLSKNNLFVISLDEERRWFRYHHLFRDLLLARLQSERPGLDAGLHRRAAGWFESNGDPKTALEHALKGLDYHYAADLMERHTTDRWRNVDLEFLAMIERLPREVVIERPSLCLFSAWMSVIFGKPERILSFVEAAERKLGPSNGTRDSIAVSQWAFAQVLRAYLADIANQSVQLDDSLIQALELIPEENTGMRNSVAVVIGTIYFMENDFATAKRCFDEALRLDQRMQGTNAVPIATARLVRMLQVQGRLREAARLLDESEQYVRQRGIRRFYIAGNLCLMRGEILLEWNRLDEAEAQIREGLRLLEDWPVPQITMLGLSFLARVQTARGDYRTARETLARLAGIRKQAQMHPDFVHAVERSWVLLWATQGDRAALEAWVKENAFASAPVFRFRSEPRHIQLCRAWLALGWRDEAARFLDQLDAAARAEGRDGSRVEILALLAAARRDTPQLAQAALDSALRLAAAEGRMRVFLDLGEPLRLALKAWLEKHQDAEEPVLLVYARGLLAAFEGVEAAVKPGGWVEALSERELEVLKLAAQGLTNQQIAARLVISVRMVKKHIENINGKLGTQNRTQAAARARDLGILTSG